MSKKYITMGFNVEDNIYDEFKQKIEENNLTIVGFFRDNIEKFNEKKIEKKVNNDVRKASPIDKKTEKAFNDKCKRLNLNMSEIVRGWIEDYVRN